MLRSFVILFAALFSLSALSSTAYGIIFGPDNRQLLTSDIAPFRSIGKIVAQDGTWGTATLIDSDLALVNASTIQNQDKSMKLGLIFYPGGSVGVPNAGVSLKKAWLNGAWPIPNERKNYAVVQLSKPLGNTYGWLGMLVLNLGNEGNYPNPHNVTFGGFSSDLGNAKTLVVQGSCRITGKDFGTPMVKHDCDAGLGSDGSPLISYLDGKWHISALASGESCLNVDGCHPGTPYDGFHWNEAIQTSEFLDLVNQARAERQ